MRASGNLVIFDKTWLAISLLNFLFYRVICLDAHRIDPTSDDMSIVVLAMGKVTIGGLTHAYNHSMVLILEEGTYKVKSDTYRLMD